MILIVRKSKNMIINFTENYRFTTRLTLKDEPIEVVSSTKLLGTIITEDLKWDMNKQNLVKKANGRMELLRKLASFGTPIEDLKDVYILFVRSMLEQSAVVWHSSLTRDNKEDLERVQRSAMRVIFQERYVSYKQSLTILGLETL